MTAYRRSDFLPFRELLEDLPEDRRRKAEAAAANIVERMHLAEIRKALATTQAELSDKAGMAQADISRVENNPEAVQLRTLQRYVAGLGGELQIVARFPDGMSAEIPLRAGRPVKSRIKIEKSPPAA